MSILDRALRVGEGKKFKEFERKVELVNAFEPELELESDDELRDRYADLRERHLNGEPLDDLLYESFALTREAAKRSLGQRHFDVQLIGGMVLHDAMWMKPIYDLLGVTVGILQSDNNNMIDKQEAYSRDVVYGTNSEFG